MTDFVFLGAIAPPPTVFVTCRHVVDYYYSKQEPGWELSNLVIQCFPEGGSPFRPASFLDKDIRVFVPKDEKLDIALIAVLPNSAGFNTLKSAADGVGVGVIGIGDIELSLSMCNTLAWGAEVGFTSIQSWTNGYPILRSGRVSSDPRIDFQSPDIGKDDIYLLEAQSFAGSSGAPVVSYPIGHPVLNGMTVKHGDTAFGFEEYRSPHLVGIISGHIVNDNESGELHRLHVGLSYCHKMHALHRVLFEEELERICPK